MNIKNLLDTSESNLINIGKNIYNQKHDELIGILGDQDMSLYENLVQDSELYNRIYYGSINISQLDGNSDEILPILAFFQRFAKKIMFLNKDIEIDNIDVSESDWKESFLNECNQKIFSDNVTKYLQCSMYEFYDKNPGMIKFKMPFLEIANAAGITYILSKYNIDRNLLNKTEEERIQWWLERMKKGGLVIPIDEHTNSNRIADSLTAHLNDKEQYLNQN